MDIHIVKRQHPTILIVNFHSACNTGDAALLESAIMQLCSSFVQPRILIAANYPTESNIRSSDFQVIQSFGALIGLNKKPVWQQVLKAIIGITMFGLAAFLPRAWLRDASWLPEGWQKFMQAYFQADLVINCPGNQFLTMGVFGWPMLISSASILCAYLVKKPVYVLPQSIGPLRRRWERNLIKWLFTRARIVFIREPLSFRLAQDLKLPAEKVKLSPDLAFESPSVDRDSALALLEKLGYDDSKGAVGVSVINRMTGSLKEDWFGVYYSAMASALERLVQKYGVRIYFFPQVTGPTRQEDDRIAARKVAELMENVKGNIVIVEEPLSPAMLKGAYGLMDIFLSTRMHSGIFASSMGTPTLFIGYLTKIRGMVESLGLQNWLIEMDEVKAECLWEKLEQLWLQKDELKRRLVNIISRVKEQTLPVGELIAEDYYGKG
jgi:colanic acid/amylovoran biosynthesis protein